MTSLQILPHFDARSQTSLTVTYPPRRHFLLSKHKSDKHNNISHLHEYILVLRNCTTHHNKTQSDIWIQHFRIEEAQVKDLCSDAFRWSTDRSIASLVSAEERSHANCRKSFSRYEIKQAKKVGDEPIRSSERAVVFFSENFLPDGKHTPTGFPSVRKNRKARLSEGLSSLKGYRRFGIFFS